MITKDFYNLVSLVAIQATNALLPLVVFPLVLKTVGTVYFSKIVTTESIVLIALTVIIYSFDIDGAAKLVYLNVNCNFEEVSEIFFTVIYSRLFILSIIVGLVLPIGIFIDSSIYILLISWLLYPLGYTLQSLWFFQAIEKNVVPALFTVASRILCVVVIIKCINEPKQYMYVPLIIGLSYLISGIFSLLYVLRVMRLNHFVPKLTQIGLSLVDGKDIFVANLSVVLFRGSNTIILSMLSTEYAVSIYSLSEKYIKCLQAVIRPVNQLVYPKIINRIGRLSGNIKSIFYVLVKYAIPQILALACIIVAFAIFCTSFGASFSFVHKILYDDKLLSLLKIMVVSVFFGVCNFIFGTAGLNHLDSKRYYANVTMTTGILTILISSILSYAFNETGASLGYVFGEACLLMFVLFRYNIMANTKQGLNT